jgi:hypothetical protein
MRTRNSAPLGQFSKGKFMNSPNHSSVLHSAIDSVTNDLREKMSRFVAKCPEMSPQNVKNGKTNPPASHRKKGLSPRQLSAARLLVAGASAVRVAKLLSIERRTIFRWKHDPTFHAEIRAQADALISRRKRPAEPPRNEFLERTLSQMNAGMSSQEMSRSVAECREMSRSIGQK